MSKSNQKNIQLVWSVLCSGIVIDQQTNNVSLYNIIEQINMPKDKLIKVPIDGGGEELGVPLPFKLFSVWHRIGKPGLISGEIKVEVEDPSNKVRKAGNYLFRLDEKSKGLRLTMPWKGIRVSSSGIYIFRILKKVKGESNFLKAGEVYLKVNILDDKQLPKLKKKTK